MWNKSRSLSLSIGVCFGFAAILTLLLFSAPWAIRLWYVGYRELDVQDPAVQKMIKVFTVSFYLCVPMGYLTLYSLLKLLFNIKREETFIPQNVKYLRRISWCCIAVALITLIGGMFYLPFLFIAVAAGFVGLMLRIVKNVMHSATEIKAENELTI